MPLKRFILEMGAGNDLHGGDYTKAALRAVQDALHHSSLAFIRSLGLNAKEMQVEVTIGVQEPAKVDAAAVKAARAGHSEGGQGRTQRARRRQSRSGGDRQCRDCGAF